MLATALFVDYRCRLRNKDGPFQRTKLLLIFFLWHHRHDQVDMLFASSIWHRVKPSADLHHLGRAQPYRQQKLEELWRHEVSG